MKYNIKLLRESELLTQKEVAELLGCSQRCYGYYDAEKHDIPTQTLIKLADIYNVSADYVLNRTANGKTDCINKEITLQFKSVRKAHGYTQSDIAKAIFVTQRTYSYYETGERDIPTQTLIRLADFYNVSVDYLLGRTENPKMNT